MTLTPVPPIAHVAVIAAERRLVSRLRAAHATVPERAIAMAGLRGIESRRLSRLARAGAVHEIGEGGWYLDEPVYAEFVAYRRRLAAIAVVAAVLATVAVYFLPGN